MDQSKLAVLGTLGIATAVGLYFAVVLSGRFADKGKSVAGSPATTAASSSSSPPKKGTADAQGIAASSKVLDDDNRGSVNEDDNNASVGRGAVPAGKGAAAAGGAAGGGAMVATAGAGNGAGEAAESKEVLIARFNKANSKAKKFFSGHRFALAAEQYGIALKLCDQLPNHDSKRTALHNNRGAAYEKDGQHALALADCSMCLSREPGHKFARVRKSRVLEALGKEEDALSEVCAHLLLERDRVQAEAALTPSKPLTPPPPPANLEGLLQKVALKRAEAILLEREQAAAKEAEAAGGGTVKRKPLVKQAVAELLRSFGSFAQLEGRYKGMQEATITREMKAAEETGASPASRVSFLLDRGMVRLVKRSYDATREDIFEAGELLATLVGADETAGDAGVSGDVEASVWEWQGTFLQLSGELDAAMEAYERCSKAAEAYGKPCPADCLIKMGWVKMEKEDTEAAKVLFARSMETHPEYSTSYAHRARAGDIGKATSTIEAGLRAAPTSDALLTLKAELKYSMAMKAGDASSAMEILALFDEAIRVNPTSPVLYINKASFLLQMMNDVGGAMEMLEKGVSVDPTSVNALVQLANLKIMVAREMVDAEAATALIDKAVALCTTKEELLETLSVRVATEGRINGAEMRSKYTRSDLDNLAEEDKQAWLEVVEEHKEGADAAADLAAAEAAIAAEAVAKGSTEVVQEAEVVEEEAKSASAAAAAAAASGGGDGGGREEESFPTVSPEENAVTVRVAAEAAAARTGAPNGRKSGWDLSGEDNTGVRPQKRATRLSCMLAAEDDDDNGVGGGCDDGGCSDLGPGEHREGGSEGGRRHTACSRPSSAVELPAWKKTALQVETPNELCVGDVVRARDRDCNGMWFEGVLTQIHDENTYEVEISGDDDDGDDEEGGPQRLTVGINDLVRVMPWFCIEVGDMVECQPDGMMCWIRGTVVDIDLSQALYDVALESEDDDDDVPDEQAADRESGGGEETNTNNGGRHEQSRARVPDSRIRKIISSRQAVAKRWKKVYLASHLTGLGRWINSKTE
eukprot:g15964.t1